jgi:hypothetical protein
MDSVGCERPGGETKQSRPAGRCRTLAIQFRIRNPGAIVRIAAASDLVGVPSPPDQIQQVAGSLLSKRSPQTARSLCDVSRCRIAASAGRTGRVQVG